MNTNPMDKFLSDEQEGHLTKIEPDPQDKTYKKDDELLRLPDPSKASAPPPMDHKIEVLDDEGDVLDEASEQIMGRPQAGGSRMPETEHPHLNQFVELPSGKRLRIVYATQGVVQLDGQPSSAIQFEDLKPHPTEKDVWVFKNLGAIEE